MAEYVGIGAYVLYLFDKAATHYVNNYDGTSCIGFKNNGASFAGLSGASGWVKLNDHSVYGAMKYACTELVDAADIETSLLVFMTWANHDIYDEDGNLYYIGTNYDGTYNGVNLPEIPADLLAQYPYAVIVEGTELKEEEPEPEPFDHYSFQVGIAMGLASVGQFKGTQKEPVAYLYNYNGTVLPELPLVEGYPCLYMYCSNSNGNYYVLYTATAFTATDSLGGMLSVSQIGTTRTLKDGKWVYGGPHSYVVYKNNTTGFEWTNTEILYDDGTIYLEASEPIPVYE